MERASSRRKSGAKAPHSKALRASLAPSFIIHRSSFVILFILTPVFWLLAPVFLHAQAKTTVTDTLYDPSGGQLNGIIILTNPATFTSADGFVIPAGGQIKATVTNGLFSVALVPNIGANPIGTSYVASYYLNMNRFQETWVVPASGPANLLAVRALTPPVPAVMLPMAQINPPSPCTAPNNFLTWNTTSWLCAAGGGGGATFQVNGTNTSGQTTVNFQNSAAFNGLTFSVANPSAGNVQLGASGTLNDAGLTAGYSGAGACAASKWASTLTRNAAPTCTQPAFTDVSGVASAAQLPNPSATTLGGIESLASAAHKWISTISTSGVPSATQPAFPDISGVASAAQLPNPSATTLGGIESLAAVGSNWINAISTSGVPSATQPAFTDISGSLACAQLPALTGDATTSAGSCATTVVATHLASALPVAQGGTGLTSLSTLAFNNSANTGTAAMTLNMSAATSVNALRTPVSAGCNPTSTGALCYDSTNGTPTGGENLGGSTSNAAQFWPFRIVSFSSTTAPAAVDAGTAGTAETSLGNTYQFPANYFVAGKTVALIYGIFQASSSTATSTIFNLRTGSSCCAGTQLFSSTAKTPANSISNSYSVILIVRCLTGGAAGTFDAYPVAFGQSAAIQGNFQVNATALPVTMDTTVAETMFLSVKFGAATAGNQAQARQLFVGEFN